MAGIGQLHIASAYNLLHAVGVSPRAARVGAWHALVHDVDYALLPPRATQ